MENLIKEIFIYFTVKKGFKPNKSQIKNELSKILLNNRNNIFNLKNTNFNLDHLDFLFIVKNGENYFKYFFDKIYLNLKNKNTNLDFYIYENNSIDNTKKILKKYKNLYIKSENTIEKNLNYHNKLSYINSLKKKRYNNIVNARNNLKLYYNQKILQSQNLKTNWLILMDIDILFDYKTIEELKKAVYSHPEGVMFCANTSYIQTNIRESYYDILALNNGEYFDEQKTHNINGIQELFDKNKDIFEIKSGFGGIALIRKDIYLENKWINNIPIEARKNSAFKQNHLCEHWDFCQKVRKHGNIYIVKKAKALWINDYNDIDFKKKCKTFTDYLNIFG